MRTWIATAIALLAGVQSGTDPNIAGELVRVRSQVSASVPESQRAALVQRLDRAEAALKAGRTYQALYLLEASHEGAAAFTFAATSGVHAFDDFLKTWARVGPPKPRGGKIKGIPAVVEAVAQAAEDRGPSTYHASKPYAQDAGIESGLYYLGESQAVMAYAAFARSRPWPAAGRRRPLRSIAPELSAFEREMTTQYETMQRADHATYIRASAALKQARSLNDHGAYEGAMLQYLLSRYLFAPLRGPAAADASPERIDAARSTLPAGEDASIGELFLQFAEEGVAGNNPDLRRGASAVVDDVLPAYLAAIAAPRPPSTSTTSASVTITLVRWPFT
jgi:hypothetical protein